VSLLARPLLSPGLLLACLATPISAQKPDGGWPAGRMTGPTLIGRTTDRALAEISGAAWSVAYPGLIWTVADGGNPATLYGIDSTGAIRRTATVPVPNIDWEEIATGECGSKTCIYIADTGDNTGRRSTAIIHRFAEPATQATTVGPVQSLSFRYPTGREDVEAMAVLPGGDVLLVSKGRSGRVDLFRLPASAWQSEVVTAELLATLPIIPAPGSGRLITGMALSADGDVMVVRTYRDLFRFHRRPDGSLEPTAACDILGREPQGEGVALSADGSMVLTSERGLFKSGTIYRVRCDAP
jgi:hypothetical protein